MATIFHLGAFICLALCGVVCKAGNCGQRRKTACYAGILLQSIGLYQSGAIVALAEINVGVAFSYYSLLALVVLAVVDRQSNFPSSWRVLSVLASLGALITMLPLAGHEVNTSARGFNIHLILATFAYGFFLSSLAQMLEIYWLNRALSSSHAIIASGNLPLLTMEKQVFRNITVGFGLLSLTIASGMLVSLLAGTGIGGLSHKILFAWLTWVFCAILLMCRWRMGWRGIIALRWFAASIVSLSLSYLGTVIVVDLILQR